MPKARAADAVSPDAAVAEAAAGWIGPQPAVAGPLDGGAFDEQIGWGAEPRVVRCDPAWKQAALARGAEALRQARAERTSDTVFRSPEDDTCLVEHFGPLRLIGHKLKGRMKLRGLEAALPSDRLARGAGRI